MSYTPYSRFTSEELIVRDYLARDRTILANERTLLAYLRTALGFIVAGASFIQFFDDRAMEVLGWLCVPLGIVFFLVGLLRYRKTEGLIRSIR